jgi:hypothetical protein
MPDCKACGEWFAKTRDDMVLCSKCERALGRLAGYAEVVVRCKNCKHYDLGVCLKIYSNGNVHPEAWQSRKPDDFCSYGERKDGADAEG